MKTMTVAGASSVFVDDRGQHRVLRTSWHAHHRIAVLSLWNGDQCTGTFRLPMEQVPALVQALSSGLVEMAQSAESMAARREQVTATLLREAEVPAGSDGPRRDQLLRAASHALDTVVRGGTRLRDRLRRR